ncbi:MAG TPA: hypothetical protein VLJ40_03815 [Arthrobacter sp.]|nr:hypothetical protein [Arthrobacter sp.]
MNQHNTPSVPATAAPDIDSQEFYLPVSGGIDPDLSVPAERLHPSGRFSRWIHALPVFGRQRSWGN